MELEKLNAVNRITLNEPLSVDSTGKQLTVKITYYGGDDPSPITATQVLSSTYHDANCIRYINLSHDLDAGEVVNVTANRDPDGWTSIANITIANGMWQLSSVIWLDDILFHNADENAHPALKEHSDSAIAAHNTNSEAHEDIRAEIEDMHAVNRIRLDAPLSVGVAGHYVRVLHRPPAGQGDETLRFSLNGAIPADAEKRRDSCGCGEIRHLDESGSSAGFGRCAAEAQKNGGCVSCRGRRNIFFCSRQDVGQTGD